MNFHKDTFMQLEELGMQFPKYQPTFDFQDKFIDAVHQSFSECPVKDGVLIEMRNRHLFNSVIKGFLRRVDALKLYELAYFVQGDILEFGTFQGLSSCILSSANKNSPHQKHLTSVDINLLHVMQTKFNLYTMKLNGSTTVKWADAANAARRLAHDNRIFEFVFVDHSHAYDPVYTVCRELRRLIKKGGFCLFHDFNDPRNKDVNDHAYKVYQAVTDGLDEDEFEFCGIYGCAALYRAI